MFKAALLLLVLLTVVSEIHYQTKSTPVVTRVLAAETEQTVDFNRLQSQKSFWQEVIANSPTYRDGFVQLAFINEALGNIDLTQEMWSRVYSLDPNFQQVRPQPR